jgi:uncharacterized linocin/CFP29 family protein
MTTPNLNAPAQVDVIQGNGSGGFQGLGPVAQALMASNFNINALRTQGLLRKDEWVLFDNAVVEVAQHNLIGVGDLMSRGLTMNVPNALGVTQIEWERVSDMGPAEISMAGVTPGRNERIDFDLERMPLPIYHKDFHLNIRMLEASRRGGMPLDTAMAGMCARKVSEAIESTLFLGNTALGSNNALYGYTTVPSRNTGSVTASWATATGAQIVGDILEMQGLSIADNMFGPWVIYVPYTVYTRLAEDYKAESDKTILSRIREIPGIADVKPSYYLSGTNVVMVMLTREVVEMIDGIQPTVVQWESNGGFTVNFKVLAIMVPRIRDTYTGQSGVIHFS